MIKSTNRMALSFVSLACLFVQTGCSLIANPNYDELASQPMVMTPSECGVRRADVMVASQQVRSFGVVSCAAHTSGLTHGPLFFEDPYVLNGSDDGQFAWTFEEPFHFLLGPVRYGVNLAFMPVSAVVNPPWIPVTVADAGVAEPQEESVGAIKEIE